MRQIKLAMLAFGRTLIYVVEIEVELNLHLSLIGSRSRAFQRDIDKAPTFPLSPPKGDSKTPLRNSSAVSAS